MLVNIAIGSGLLVLTTFIHASAMVAAIGWVTRAHVLRLKEPHWKKARVVAKLVLTMLLASLLESGLWAVTYLLLGAITGVERALYFSTVTFTTLGFGDVVLEGRWRLLAAMEAANGIILFGWTTAVIVAAVQRVYFSSLAAFDQLT